MKRRGVHQQGSPAPGGGLGYGRGPGTLSPSRLSPMSGCRARPAQLYVMVLHPCGRPESDCAGGAHSMCRQPPHGSCARVSCPPSPTPEPAHSEPTGRHSRPFGPDPMPLHCSALWVSTLSLDPFCCDCQGWPLSPLPGKTALVQTRLRSVQDASQATRLYICPPTPTVLKLCPRTLAATALSSVAWEEEGTGSLTQHVHCCSQYLQLSSVTFARKNNSIFK